MKLGLQLTPALRATAGYNFTYVSRVVRPGNEVDLTINRVTDTRPDGPDSPHRPVDPGHHSGAGVPLLAHPHARTRDSTVLCRSDRCTLLWHGAEDTATTVSKVSGTFGCRHANNGKRHGTKGS